MEDEDKSKTSGGELHSWLERISISETYARCLLARASSSCSALHDVSSLTEQDIKLACREAAAHVEANMLENIKTFVPAHSQGQRNGHDLDDSGPCSVRKSPQLLRSRECILLNLPPGLLVRAWPTKRIILGRRTCTLLHGELLRAPHILQEFAGHINFDGRVVVIAGECQFVDRSANRTQVKINSEWSNAQPKVPVEFPQLELTDSWLSGMHLDASSHRDWTIVFAGRALVRPEYDNCIILGPGGKNGNDQLRYEFQDTLALYVGAATFASQIKLPVDPMQFHMLTLTWSQSLRAIEVYQNCTQVATIPRAGAFSLNFLRVASWFGGRFQSKLGVHRLLMLHAAVDREEVCEIYAAVLREAPRSEG